MILHGRKDDAEEEQSCMSTTRWAPIDMVASQGHPCTPGCEYLCCSLSPSTCSLLHEYISFRKTGEWLGKAELAA